MVVNLYRNKEYCQVWNRESTLVVHRGVLGQRGVVTEKEIPATESLEIAIQRAVQAAQATGFAPLQPEQQSQVLVNFNVSTWESSEIMSFHNTVQTVLNELLGWTGNGFCDGYTVGSEGLTMWCVVVESALAVSTLISGLDNHRLLYDDDDGPAKLAIPTGDRYTLVFPEELRGERLL